MKKPSEDRFVIIATMSRIEATEILNTRDKQGWQLRGFAVRDQDFVMVFEKRVEEETWTLSDSYIAKEAKKGERKKRWKEEWQSIEDRIRDHFASIDRSH